MIFQCSQEEYDFLEVIMGDENNIILAMTAGDSTERVTLSKEDSIKLSDHLRELSK